MTCKACYGTRRIPIMGGKTVPCPYCGPRYGPLPRNEPIKWAQPPKPKDLKKKKCPDCGNEMRYVDVGLFHPYWRCDNCGEEKVK